jgi:hypothetical protein
MATELKCHCGKVLGEFNVCPLPRGRACGGPNEVVAPWIREVMGCVLDTDFDFEAEGDDDDFG